MTQFELFCAVFYALDAVWERTGGKEFREAGFKDASIRRPYQSMTAITSHQDTLKLCHIITLTEYARHSAQSPAKNGLTA